MSFLVRFIFIEKCTFWEFTCCLSLFDHKAILKMLSFSYVPHDKKMTRVKSICAQRVFVFRNDPYEIRIGVNIGKDISESTQTGDQNLRTLMDFQNIETYFPKLKFPEQESTYSSFLKSKIDETDLLKIVHANGEVILSDCFIVTLKLLITGVRFTD